MKFGTYAGLFLFNLINTVVAVNYFNADHLVSWPRPTSMKLSPDKKLGIYFAFSYDISKRNATSDAFIMKLPESGAHGTSTTYKVTKLFANFEGVLNNLDSITWLAKDCLAFVFKNQLFTLDVPTDLGNMEQNRTVIPSPYSISHFHNMETISDLTYYAESQTLIFSAIVMTRSNHQKFGDLGVIYDQLPVRQWDKFINPFAKKQLHYVKITKSSNNKSNFVISDGPHNLLENTELESPAGSFGDANDYCLSPDGKELAFVSKSPRKDQTWSSKPGIFIVLIGHRDKPKSLTPGNVGDCSQPRYSPDGKYLVWLQMKSPIYDTHKNHIILYDRSSGKTKELISLWDRSPSTIEWSGNSDKILMIAEEYGRKRVFYIALSSDHVQQVTKYGSAYNLQFVRDNVYITSLSGFSSPPEFFTFELKDDFHLIRQSNINYERAKMYSFSNPEDFWFKGSDNHPVHGFLVRPRDFNPCQKYPLAFFIHGGPQGAWADEWSIFWSFHLFAKAGYFVVAINPHGSTGYGQNFTNSIRKDWGGKPYKDLMLGLDYVLENNNNIDHQRVCALGPSYGGYMINWINGHSNRFRCLVNHDGVFDVKHSYYTSDVPYFFEQNFGSTPYKDPNLFEKFSPSSYVSNWSTPTMVIHGGRDFRLVDGEGLATFTALQRRGIQSRLLYFPFENHWVKDKSNARRWHYEVLNWLNLFCHPNISSAVYNCESLKNNTVNMIPNESYNSSVIVSLPPTCPSHQGLVAL